MISILLAVKTVYIHESPDKTTASLRRRRADLITCSGMTNRRVEARASAQQLELATNKPFLHYLLWFLQNPLSPSTLLIQEYTLSQYMSPIPLVCYMSKLYGVLSLAKYPELSHSGTARV
jgi:hypothetical protein